MTASAAHVRTSTLISVAISMAISAAFFLLIFGREAQIAVFGSSGLAVDLIPQTLVAGFMAALVPALQTRAKVAADSLAGIRPSLQRIALRAVLLAVSGLVLATALAAILALAGIETMSWSGAIAFKTAYGGLLGLIVTPAALHPLLLKE